MRKWIGVLDARDRALLERWVVGMSDSSRRRRWQQITVLGGTRGSILTALLPLPFALFTPSVAATARALFIDAALTLAISHLVVQLIKRTAVRPRPGSAGPVVPDAFSFPSGHACAAAAVAVAYAAHLPSIALGAIAIGMVVGYSRVALGVHYPGDVIAGQGIAVLTGLAVITP
jgi:undecaprenyl-diphosphatase